jgi:hypothetical protein
MVEREEIFVELSDIAHGQLCITTQAASYYLEGLAGCPNFGHGLEVIKEGSYHSWKMPVNDAKKFIRKIKKHREQKEYEKTAATL